MSVVFVVSCVCLFLFWGGKPGFLYHLNSCTDDLQVAHLISCTTLFPVEMTSGAICTGNQEVQEIRWATLSCFLLCQPCVCFYSAVARLVSCTTWLLVQMTSRWPT